jgi:hypothetical protein
MDTAQKEEILEQLASDMQRLALLGTLFYSQCPRVITIPQEAAYRLCHHDFFNFTHAEAAEILGVDRTAITKRLQAMRKVAPQLFPILPKNVARIYRMFAVDNMRVRAIADELHLHPRYCWQVLRNLFQEREQTGLYFRTNTGARLRSYGPWLDKDIKETW